MGGGNQQLTGPDFKQGVSSKEFGHESKILGHADGEAVLVVQRGEEYFAVGAMCSHYGANLNDGVVTDHSIRCPWHHACFDLKTGAASKAPALNALPTWRTEVKDGMLYVREKHAAEQKPIAARTKEHFAIVGSGAAGHAAAERLRQAGFAGMITIFTADSDLPYDRPNLSKDYLAGSAPPEWIPLRPEEFYKEHAITIRLGTKVSKLSSGEKKLHLENGESVSFDKCLLATGGTPNRPPILGAELPHVHVLRSFADCKSLIEGLGNAKKVMIVGAGFIGLEAAAAIRARGLEVSIVAPNEFPLDSVMGKEAGAFLQALHEKNGVQFYLGRSVKMITEKSVLFDNGKEPAADLVLLAVGIKPNLELAQGAGLLCQEGVVVNEFLETSASGIFAAGDIAYLPSPISGGRYRAEHWAVAQRQGQSAALNMLGQNQEHNDIPFFWSQQFGIVLNYVGNARDWTKAEVHGNLKGGSGAVAFYKQGQIAAVLTIGQDLASLKIEKALEDKDQKAIHEILRQI